MKASFDRKSLLEALTAMSRVAPSNTPSPILQSFLLVIQDGLARLVGTDMEQEVSIVLKCDSERNGVVVLPTEQVRMALSRGDDDKVSVELWGSEVRITGDSAEFALATEDPSKFPAVPGFEATSYWVVSARDLKRAIRRTKFATDPNQYKWAVAGVLAEPGDGTLTFVALDGRRMASQEIPASLVGDPVVPKGSVSIPPKALTLIDGHLDKADDSPVHVWFDENQAMFRTGTGTTVIRTRLVDGKFPPWRQLLASSFLESIPINVGRLRTAVQQAEVVMDETTKGVDFRFADGKLTISGGNGRGRVRTSTPIEYDGELYEIRFTPKYLIDSLRAMDEDQEIRVELGGQRSIPDGSKEGEDQTSVFYSGDGYIYLLRPMGVRS